MPGDRFTLVTTMRNEGAFLLEWVAHHKARGFDDLVICTNDCDDPTADMVKRLQKMGLARFHATRYRPDQSIQRRALRQALRLPEVQQADWIYVCDADEFLASRAGDGSVRALVAAGSAGVQAISVPWRRFGTGGQADYIEGRITRQFRRANATQGPTHVPHAFPKTLIRADVLPAMDRLGVHVPVMKPGTALHHERPGGLPAACDHGKLHVPADYSIAQVNHYQLRSRDSFLVKSARGKVNHVNDKMDYAYWQFNDIAEQDCDLIDRYEPAVQRWMEDLLADARLAMLHHRAVRWHRDKIAALHADPAWRPMIDRIDAHRARSQPPAR